MKQSCEFKNKQSSQLLARLLAIFRADLSQFLLFLVRKATVVAKDKYLKLLKVNFICFSSNLPSLNTKSSNHISFETYIHLIFEASFISM